EGLIGTLSETSAPAVNPHPEPRVRVRHAIADLCYALADLAASARARAVVRLCAEPETWELGLERSGADLLVTVFRSGDLPEVLVHERRTSARSLAARALALAGSRMVANDAPRRRPEGDGLLEQAHGALFAALPFATELEPMEPAAVSVEPT